jgi:hypothetical protein
LLQPYYGNVKFIGKELTEGYQFPRSWSTFLDKMGIFYVPSFCSIHEAENGLGNRTPHLPYIQKSPILQDADIS